MLLFTISARAGGTLVLSGDHLDLGEVQRALNALEDYWKIIPVSVSIVSKKELDDKRPHECMVLDIDDYVAGKHGLKRYDLIDYQAIVESTGVDAKDLDKINPFGGPADDRPKKFPQAY